MSSKYLLPAFIAMAFSSVATAAGQSSEWAFASRDDQMKALAFIEGSARTRSAGFEAAASEFGIDGSTPNETGESGSWRQAGARREFGRIAFNSALSRSADGEAEIILNADGGCVERDIARSKLLLRDVVWSSPADDPFPVMGYALFTGGSAVTLFFDAAGRRCLTAVKIEDEERLMDKMRRRDAEK